MTQPQQDLIKDLSRNDFEGRYSCDRLTATVLNNKFQYIVEHMCSGLLNTAFSIILRDWYDFAAVISGPRSLGYPMPAVSNSLLLFIGTMDEAVHNAFEEWGIENVRPGDVLIANDPYRIGNHVNDLCLMRPVFYPGSEEPVAFITLRAHMLDMGGVVPAGFSGTKKNVYENGLVLAPRLLYRDDQPVKETYDLIFDNARFGELLLSDLTSIYHDLLLAEKMLVGAIDRYGLDAYLGSIRYACDLGAETMSAGIGTLPDGDYFGEEQLDCDGIDDTEAYKVKVAVRVRGERAEVDLSGTSRQARTSINAGWLDARTATAVALKLLLDPKTPYTSGAMRNVDLVLPEGTLVSALPPDGAIFLYWEATNLVVNATFRALEQALGVRAAGGDYLSLNIHNANGVFEDGTPWVTMAQCGGEHGPWGATQEADGETYTVWYQANNIDPPTEAIEKDFPVVLLRKDYAPDTSGPGTNRGGAAVVKDTLWLSDAEHYSTPLHVKRPSGFGVYGGETAPAGATWVWEPEAFDVRERKEILGMAPEVYGSSTPVAGMLDPETKCLDPDGQYFYFARVPIWKTRPGTIFRYITNGAGGWGKPADREPERVLRDVRDGYITIQGAARDYGVAVTGDPEWDPEGLEIDHEETRRLRAQMAA